MTLMRAIAALLALTAPAAVAQGGGGPAALSQPAAPEARQSTAGGESDQQEAFGGPIWQRGNLFGDPGGLRSRLAQHGVTFGLTELAEVLGNPIGGTRQGAVFEGLLSMGFGVDTEKAGLWQGGIFNVTAYQIHGRGLSFNNLDNNGNTVSGLEALRGTLLFELWYEQYLFDRKLSVRVGQLAADQEFMASQYAGLFINHTFGWSTFPSADLPSAGPSYPLATPGVRVRYTPRDDLTFLVGVFNGDPAGPGAGIPQMRNPSGTAFRVNDGAFVIGELQYATGGGTYKLGAWYDTQVFQDQRISSRGVSLADPMVAPGTNGRGRRGDYSVYAVADQLVWRKQGATDGGIGVFARLMGAPGDRNLLNFYVDAGVTWKGVVPGRDNDTAGLGFALSRTSDTAVQRDKDTRALADPSYPLRRHESVLELTYQVQIAPWWQVQPTAQYILNLNGGVPNPLNPAKRLGDAAVFGVRTDVTF